MNNKILLLLLIVGIGLSYGQENIKLCGIRISFPPDNNEATSGNGQFLLSKDSVDMDLLQPLPVDPPPHDKSYFEDHIRALANYYKKASSGMVQIDTVNSKIYPQSKNGSYQLAKEMAYYHPFLKEDSVEIRLNELIRDAVRIADDDINYRSYDIVVVFHAGLGQIYNIDLDPTPKDIKSAYMGLPDFKKYLGLSNGIEVNDGNHYVTDAIVLPETQNYIQYDNWEEVFGELDNPEEYQFGLNGTFALMMGFYLGLPSLTDTSGGSSAGKFGLMDQGSANLNSLVPALPSAWERVYMGWEDPILIQDDHNHINLNHAESNQDSLILKVPIDNDEYYLIENRYNFLHDNTNLDTIRSREMREYEDKYKDVYPPVLPLVKDSIGAQFSKNGVLLSVPRYDVGIPGSGLMIWHIDESIITRHINDNLVNISEYERGVDLEEGDGAQDLGFEASILVEEKATGWSVDPWYEGNQGFFHLNPEYTSSSGERVGFTPNTTPNTSNNKHAFSGIYIDSIGLAGPTMNFRVQWDKESGSNIDLALPSDFQAYDMLPINLQSDTLNGLAVLGKELLVLDALTQEDKKVYSDNSFDIGKYSKATLLFDNNARLLYALAESEESFKVVCWEIDNNGKISFLDEKEKSGEKVTSNSVLANGAVLIGAVSNGENLIYKFKLLNEKVSLSEKTVNKKINALAGNSDNLYYLADGSVGTINADNLQPIEILADGKIHGDKIILGLADNNSALDLIFSDDRRLGIIKDVSNNDELRTIKTSSINGISFSDIDFDGRGEILVSTNNGDLEVYNSELYLKNNFPVNFSATFIGEPLSSDLTENDVNDILLLSKSGELYGVDNKANYTANLPIATEIENADQGCLINTSKGIGLISLNRRTGKLAGKVIGTGKISETAWYCEGGNINRSYIHSAWTDGESPKVQSVLNKAKTFCWPNPVKGNSTNLRYYLNKSGQVKIKIYDLAGNFVHSLQDESPAEREANEIQWDVSNIESGVYFAVVKATDESGSSQKEIIKIMVIK